MICLVLRTLMTLLGPKARLIFPQDGYGLNFVSSASGATLFITQNFVFQVCCPFIGNYSALLSPSNYLTS